MANLVTRLYLPKSAYIRMRQISLSKQLEKLIERIIIQISILQMTREMRKKRSKRWIKSLTA